MGDDKRNSNRVVTFDIDNSIFYRTLTRGENVYTYCHLNFFTILILVVVVVVLNGYLPTCEHYF